MKDTEKKETTGGAVKKSRMDGTHNCDGKQVINSGKTSGL